MLSAETLLSAETIPQAFRLCSFELLLQIRNFPVRVGLALAVVVAEVVVGVVVVVVVVVAVVVLVVVAVMVVVVVVVVSLSKKSGTHEG